jgi:hypothetical protein
MAPTRVAIKEESGSAPIRTDIEPFLDQIEDPIDKKHAGRDAGERREELDHDGQHMQPAEDDRRGHD